MNKKIKFKILKKYPSYTKLKKLQVKVPYALPTDTIYTNIFCKKSKKHIKGIAF